MNLVLRSNDEQQRRWYVAQEAEKIGHSGNQALVQFDGQHES